jgi:hypothetical protein
MPLGASPYSVFVPLGADPPTDPPTITHQLFPPPPTQTPDLLPGAQKLEGP